MDRPTIGMEMELLTVNDAAEELGVSIWTVYRRVWDGSLKSYRLGQKATLVTRADLEAFKAAREAG